MKVILLKDVIGTGKANEVKEVSSGYAINYLLPNKLATAATVAAVVKLKQQAAHEKREIEVKSQQFKLLLQRLNNGTVRIKSVASDSGTLYAGIGASDISLAIKKQYQAEVPNDAIIIKDHLKTIGSHQVIIKLAPAGEAIFFVNIEKA